MLVKVSFEVSVVVVVVVPTGTLTVVPLVGVVPFVVLVVPFVGTGLGTV